MNVANERHAPRSRREFLQWAGAGTLALAAAAGSALQQGVLGVYDPLHIEPSRPTLASLLKQQGYATAAIGKWHLGYGDKKPLDYTAPLRPGPKEIGFDTHFGVPSNHGDATGVYIENAGVRGLRSKELKPFGKSFYNNRPYIGLDAPQRTNETVISTLTDQAVAWLDE